MDSIKDEIQRSAVLDKKNKDILMEMYEKSIVEGRDMELEDMFNKLIEKVI